MTDTRLPDLDEQGFEAEIRTMLARRADDVSPTSATRRLSLVADDPAPVAGELMLSPAPPPAVTAARGRHSHTRRAIVGAAAAVLLCVGGVVALIADRGGDDVTTGLSTSAADELRSPAPGDAAWDQGSALPVWPIVGLASPDELAADPGAAFRDLGSPETAAAAYLAELAPPPVSAPLALPLTVAGPPTRVGTSAGGTAQVPWASEDNGGSEEPLASGSVYLRNAGDASTPAWVVVGATTDSLDGDAVTLEDVHSDGERLVFTVVGPPPETGQSLSVRVGVDGEFVIAGRHEIPGARSPVWGDLVDPAPDGRAVVEVAVEPGDTVDILVRGSNPDSSFLSVTHMAFVVPAPDPAEAPPTTAGQPPDAPQTVGAGSSAPPTSPPAASDPADGIATTAVEGTFLGNEVFTPTDGGCPDLDHVLVSTFTLTDGTTWDFDAEYCGDLDGSAWSGEGTFTFTTPESDTLHGTFESAVTVISDGEPYELDIAGGTGRYAGASGSCQLDNHLALTGPDTQEQSGTFSCEISAPASG